MTFLWDRDGGVCASCGTDMVDYGWCPNCQQFMRSSQ